MSAMFCSVTQGLRVEACSQSLLTRKTAFMQRHEIGFILYLSTNQYISYNNVHERR